MHLIRNFVVAASRSGRSSRGFLPALFKWLKSVCSDCDFSQGSDPVNVSFQGVQFHNNSATGNGGAVDTPGTSQLTFTDCTFDGNSSGSQGGAVSVGVGTVTVTDCTFSNNSAASQGGAVNSNFAANYTLTDCTIAVNDDCIALKGTKGPFALEDKDSPPDQHIRIAGCTFGIG